MFKQYYTLFLLLISTITIFAQDESDEPIKCYSKELAQLLEFQNSSIANQRIKCDDLITKMTMNANDANLKIANNTYTIPVVFHVIHQPGEAIGQGSNLAAEDLFLTVQQLNDAYSNSGDFYVEGGFDTGFRFCLAQFDPNGNPSNGINRMGSQTYAHIQAQTEEPAIKENTIRWDANKYLNIWVVDEVCWGDNCEIGGYSYQANTHGTIYDGIVIEDTYADGHPQFVKILIHEIGHYFDLYHPFEGGCTNNNCMSDNDRVCDTPPENSQLAHSCDTNPNSCTTDDDDISDNNPFRPISFGGLGDQTDLIENYMDYGYLNCRTCFTPGQVDRMHLSFNNFRSSLINSSACTTDDNPPIEPETCISPEFIQLNNTTATTANFGWSQAIEADSYLIEYRIVGSSDFEYSTTNGTQITLTGLLPSTSYTYNITSICDGQQSSESSISGFFTTGIETCGTPLNVSAQNVGPNNALIVWGTVNNANGYVCSIRKQGQNWIDYQSSSNSKYISSLSADTNYEVRVRSNCDGTNSAYSSIYTFTTEEEPITCVAPSGLNITSIATNNVTISWNTSSNADYYVIGHRKSSESSFQNSIAFSTTFTIDDLDPNTLYYIMISSVCDGQTITNNSTVSFTTQAEQATIECNHPINLSASNITPNSAVLNWQANGDPASYVLQFREGGETWIPFNVSSTQYSTYTLKPGTYYEFRVYAVCQGYSSEYSSIYGFTTPQETINCNAPSNLQVQNVNYNSGFATWTANADATSYKIGIRKAGTSNWINYTTTETLFNFSNLNASTTYVIIVSSVCADIESGDYATISFVTEVAPPPACPAPDNLVVSNVTQTSASFSWNGSSDANNYYLFLKKEGEDETNFVVQSNQFSINSLESGTNYEIRVLSTCNGVTSQFSTTKYFTTSQASTPPPNNNSCHAPSELSIMNISQTTALVEWPEVSGSSFYILGYTRSGVENAWEYIIVNNDNKYTLTGLSSNSNYAVKVRSMCGVHSSDFTTDQLFTTLPTNTQTNNSGTSTGNTDNNEQETCDIPSGIQTIDITNNSVNLQWDETSSANQYIVHLEGDALDQPQILYANDNEFDLINLQANSSYSVKLKSICGIDISGYSQIFSFVTTNQSAQTPDGQSQACAAPDNLNILAIGSNMIQISWNNSEGADFYQADLFENGNFLKTKSVTAATVTFTDVNTNSNLTIRIRSKCGQYWSQYTDFMTITTENPTLACDAPVSLNESAITSNEVLLSWNNDQSVDSYELVMWQEGYENVTANYTVYTNSRSINTLISCITYNWKIRPICNGVVGEYSESSSFTTTCEVSACEAKGLDSSFGYIAQVKVGDVGNITDNDNGYGNYTYNRFEVTKGSSNTFEMKSSSNIPFYWGIWIDRNKDGVFDKYNERVYLSTTPRFGTCAGFITISPEASEGRTTMRVVMSTSLDIDPCSDFETGEIEDYTIEVTE